DRREARADRPGVDLAHEAPDLLQLAAPRLAARDAPCLLHGGLQILRQVDRLELPFGKRDELGAELLERVHFLLAPRLADDLLGHRCIIARHVEGPRAYRAPLAARRAGVACRRARLQLQPRAPARARA